MLTKWKRRKKRTNRLCHIKQKDQGHGKVHYTSAETVHMKVKRIRSISLCSVWKTYRISRRFSFFRIVDVYITSDNSLSLKYQWSPIREPIITKAGRQRAREQQK